MSVIQPKKNNVGSVGIKPSHTLHIRNGFVQKFADQITLTEKNKNDRLHDIVKRKFKYKNGKSQEGFPERNVYFDQVVNVEYVEGTTEYVYDLTVKTTRNFQLWNGLNQRDTFHKAGSSDRQPVTSKFSELLNATKDPKVPSFLVYFNGGNETIAQLRDKIGDSIIQLTFARITKHFTIHTDKEPEPWYAAYKIIEGSDFEEYTDCISLHVNMDILYEYKITLRQIAEFVSQEYSDMSCVYSPDCYGRLDVFIDTRSIDLPEETLVFVTQDNVREIYLEEVVQPILENIVFCGITGVENMFFSRDSDSKNDSWMIETENSKTKLHDSITRYKHILAHPAVDMTRTVSNNVWDIYHTLGIEAVREYMIEQFSEIMEGINICHVMLLVDKMTYSGSISSISRYTMRREDSGPFGKASFEETLDNFLKAAVYGQEEPTRGVSASIICGKRAQIGTGLCELRMDMSKLGVIEEE